MLFTSLRKLVNEHTQQLLQSDAVICRTAADSDALFELYLDSWPPELNPIFRQRRTFDCSTCKQFVKRLGNIVAIKDGVLTTIWDVATTDPVLSELTGKLSEYVKSFPIENYFLVKPSDSAAGVDSNVAELEDGSVITFSHFYAKIPSEYIHSDCGTELASLQSTQHVFKRGLTEITEDAVQTVLELIAQNSIYRGAEWTSALETFLQVHSVYKELSEANAEIFTWELARKCPATVSRLRNTSMGTLLQAISNGDDLEKAVTAFETMVAPSNYKRPKAIITPSMIKSAKQTVEKLGYLNSLPRRFATSEDISINNVLYANRALRTTKSKDDIFSKLEAHAAPKTSTPRQFNKVQEITYDKFIQEVLPTAESVSLLFEARLQSRLVSLIAPKIEGSRSMFKWSNGFSWTYNGDVADSLKPLVEKAGGKTVGELRFSLAWNRGSEFNQNDLDAHCTAWAANGCEIGHIYFVNTTDSRIGGQLDVDIIHPKYGQPAVENIIIPKINKSCSRIVFSVNCYNRRCEYNDFEAELELMGTVYKFHSKAPLHTGSTIDVAELTKSSSGNWVVKPLIPTDEQHSQTIWNLNTNTFVPVNMMMYSPNYWEGEPGVGNKHVFFLLEGCKHPDSPNGFFNEYLDNALLEHKRVFEVLGNEMKAEPSEDQLSGIGISTTLHDHVIVKVTGQAVERVLKIIF